KARARTIDASASHRRITRDCATGESQVALAVNAPATRKALNGRSTFVVGNCAVEDGQIARRTTVEGEKNRAALLHRHVAREGALIARGLAWADEGREGRAALDRRRIV